MHDVAIAGGGPAGSALAIHLARMGLRVVLLERAAIPRRKACGEGIFPLGVRELERLGLAEQLRASAAKLDRVAFHAGRARAGAAISPGGATALGVRRDLLDAALVEAAARAGAEVRTGVLVQGLRVVEGRATAFATSAGDVPARAFAGADGLHSRVRKAAGLDAQVRGTRYGQSAHAELAGPADAEIAVHFLEPGAELYVTPVGGRCVNVALLANLPWLRARWSKGQSLFAEAARRVPILEGATFETVPYRRKRATIVSGAGPFPVRARRAWRGNVLLAGDAAGFFDGITGEGISIALRTAPLAARAIAAHLESGSFAPFREYDRQLSTLVRPSTLLARLTLFLARHPALAERAVAGLGRHPSAFERLIAVNSGELPLGSLRPRDLLALLAGT